MYLFYLKQHWPVWSHIISCIISFIFEYFVLTFGRLENQLFVKATSENEALELAKENLEEWGGESDWDEDLTHSEAKLLDLTQNRLKSWDDLDDNHSREEYHMMIYQDENVEDILKKQQRYVWDCGT